jgi:hypothetical protein
MHDFATNYLSMHVGLDSLATEGKPESRYSR